jgi:hypothetical protein
MGIVKYMFGVALVFAAAQFFSNPKGALNSINEVLLTPSPRFFQKVKESRSTNLNTLGKKSTGLKTAKGTVSLKFQVKRFNRD